jgi:hypothetical protein
MKQEDSTVRQQIREGSLPGRISLGAGWCAAHHSRARS